MEASTKNHVFINQIQPGMKNINATFIILEIGTSHRTQQGSDVRTIKVADQTGSINLCLWNEQSENIGLKKVFSLRNGFATLHKGRLSLSFAKSGELSKPLDITIPFVETPDMSSYNAENDTRSTKRSANDEDREEGPARKTMAVDASKHVYIHQLQPGMKNVNTFFIVIDVGLPRQTSQGNEVRNIKVADHTGSIQMSVWNELGEFVTVGDILRLRNGCVSVHKGYMALSVGKAGEVLKTGEFFLQFSETPDMSVYNPELDVSSTISNATLTKSIKEENINLTTNG